MSGESVTFLVATVALSSFVAGVLTACLFKAERETLKPEQPPCPLKVGDRVLLDGYDLKPREVLALRFNGGLRWQALVRIETLALWKDVEQLALAAEGTLTS